MHCRLQEKTEWGDNKPEAGDLDRRVEKHALEYYGIRATLHPATAMAKPAFMNMIG